MSSPKKGDLYLLTSQEGPDGPELLVELVRCLSWGDAYGSIWEGKPRGKYPPPKYPVYIIPHDAVPRVASIILLKCSRCDGDTENLGLCDACLQAGFTDCCECGGRGISVEGPVNGQTREARCHCGNEPYRELSPDPIPF